MKQKNWIKPRKVTFKERIKLLFIPMKVEFVSHQKGISEVKYKIHNGITYLYKNNLIFEQEAVNEEVNQ